ncbi:MAG: hypothetical protein AAB285_03460 [candidate division NC10 bacterium]
MVNLSLDAMRQLASLNGFQWTDEELEHIRPALERAMEPVARFEELSLDAVEPVLQYRVG